jgi:hypothetical protein
MEHVNRRAGWQRLLLFVLLSLLTRWLSLVVDVIDLDESAHIVGSWEMMRGRLLYADFVDNKAPLLYVYYALAQMLFGRGLLAVHLLTALVTIPLTAYAVSAFFHHRREGLVSGVLFLAYSAAFIGHDMLASNTEILMILPATWAVAMLRDEREAMVPWRASVSGFLIAVGVLFRYQAAAWGLAVAAAIVVAGRGQRNLRRTIEGIFALGAGFMLPLVATWGWYVSRGAGDALLYWTVGNNLAYLRNPISAREAAERALSYGVPFAIVTAPLWWAAWRWWTAERWSYRSVLVLCLIATSFATAVLGFRFYPHYFIQLYPPLALAAAPWATNALDRRPPRSRRVLVVWTATALVAFTAVNAWLYLTPNRIYRERDPAFAEIAQFLREDSCYTRGTLFVWGYAPIIYYYADMPAASRFVVLAQARLTGYVAGNLGAVRAGEEPDGQVVEAHWDWLMDDLRRRATTFIVDTAPAGIYRWDRYPLDRYRRLRQYVDEEFELAGEVRGVRIYRRRGCVRG